MKRAALIHRVHQGDVKHARKLTNSRTLIVLDHDGAELTFVYSSAQKKIISFVSSVAAQEAGW
jgi:hypothetical protein